MAGLFPTCPLLCYFLIVSVAERSQTIFCTRSWRLFDFAPGSIIPCYGCGTPSSSPSSSSGGVVGATTLIWVSTA